jgi:threonine dehydratase
LTSRPTLAEIEAARERIGDSAIRTPLVRLDVDGEIYLKLENLQPIGSFKLRGARPEVFPEMFELARKLLAGSLVVTLEETTAAARLLAERAHVIAEGAGAVPVAAALSGRAGDGRIACIVSGGSIDSAAVAAILRGEIP